MSADKSAHDLPEPIALRLLLDQVPAILWTTDRALRLTSCEGAGLHPLHLEGNQLVGKTLFEHFNTQDADYPPIAAHFRALGGEAGGYELAVAGRNLVCHVEPLPGAEGDSAGVIGIALDVTERKRVEIQLRECRKQLRARAQAEPRGSRRKRSVRKDTASATPIPNSLLTIREWEVLRLIVEGLSGPEIADRLLISPRTVEGHRGNLMRKLGVRNQRELVRHAVRGGILAEDVPDARDPDSGTEK